MLKCYGKDCLEKNLRYSNEQLTKFKGKNYCQKCYPKVKKEFEDRQVLTRQIKKYYRIKYPTPMMWKQIKRFIEEGLTYEEISKCIEYQYGHKGYDGLQIKYGLGFVSYIYTDVSNLMAQNKKIKTNKKTSYNLLNISISKDKMDIGKHNDLKESKIIDMNDKEIIKNG